MKRRDLKFLFNTGFVDFKADKAKCGLNPGVWEPYDAKKDGIVGSSRDGWMKKDGVFSEGKFVKTHRRFNDDVDMFFEPDGQGHVVKLKDVREPLFPRLVAGVADFLCKAVPWALGAALAFITLGAIMYVREQKAEAAKLVSCGWTYFEDDNLTEWELLEREKARNEFGDERGKYVFHVMKTQYGSVLCKAHSLTNSCEACGKAAK